MVEYGSSPEEFCGNESFTPKRIPYFFYRNPQFLYLTPEEVHGLNPVGGGGGGGPPPPPPPPVTVLQRNGAVNVKLFFLTTTFAF